MRKHCKTCCLCLEKLRLQQKEPKIGAAGNVKAMKIKVSKSLPPALWFKFDCFSSVCHLQIPNICLLHPPLQESPNTARMLPALLCPTLSTRIEWNIRNVIEYLISTLHLLDTQQTAWLLCFTASQLGFSEWQRSMLTGREKPCRSMWHFAMTWSMTRTGSRGIELKH